VDIIIWNILFIMTKKCSRCKNFYSHVTVNACTHHSSPWIDLHTNGRGRTGVWTCCKSPSRTDPGCTTSTHIEDVQTSKLLQNFHIVAVEGTRSEALELLSKEYFQSSLNSNYQQYLNLGTLIDIQDLVPDENGNIKHEVKKTDTLVGVALKYDTTVAKLKQINKLFSNDELYKLKHLVVPASPTALNPDSPKFSEAFKIRKLAELTLASPEECKFYLEDNFWDVHMAMESRAKDLAWAESELRNGKGKFTEFFGDRDFQTVAVVGVGAAIVILCILL